MSNKNLTSRRNFMQIAGATGIVGATQLSVKAENSEDNKTKAAIPFIRGKIREVIHANPDKPGEKGWFTNDHCFIESKDGRLHWFGINNPFPPKGKELYRYHPYLGHLSTDDPMGNWKRHPWALDESKGTEYLGAPFVIWHEKKKKYVMVVETWLDKRRLEVCWSDDLENWERTRKAILPDKLWISTRDPQIISRPDGSYWILVTSHNTNNIKQSQIIRITTKDFENFDDPEIILGIDDCKWATLMESPYLWQHENLWYLFFTYAHRHYTETPVVISDNPNHFNFEQNCITTLYGHASVIFNYKNKTYISSCGPEDKSVLNKHGVSLAELGWAKQI